MTELTPGFVAGHLPRRPDDAHKGTMGTLCSITGSYGFSGAAVLSARAALRSGVGLHYQVIPEKIYPVFASSVFESVCVPVRGNTLGTVAPTDLDAILNTADRATAVLIGCGMGCTSATAEVLRAVLTSCRVPVVVDADGINALSQHKEILSETHAPLILTPHIKEFSRLSGLEVADIPVQSYRSGQACEPHPTVVDIESGATLSEGTDYTLSWSDNDCVGKGTVTITGTGSFDGKSQTATFSIVPRLPAGYKPVEYAHSSGEQFVDTGFVPDEKTRADIRFLMHSTTLNGGYSSPFGARNGNVNQFFVVANHNDDKKYFFSRHGEGATDLPGTDGYAGSGALKGHPSDVRYHQFSLNRNVFNLDGYSYSFSSSVTFACDCSAYAFATHDYAQASATHITQVPTP